MKPQAQWGRRAAERAAAIAPLQRQIQEIATSRDAMHRVLHADTFFVIVALRDELELLERRLAAVLARRNAL